MQVTIQDAKSQLEKLIDAAKAGEDVILANGDTPVAKIVALPPLKKTQFKIGILEGKLGELPDFLEPMSEEDLALWEGRE